MEIHSAGERQHPPGRLLLQIAEPGPQAWPSALVVAPAQVVWLLLLARTSDPITAATCPIRHTADMLSGCREILPATCSTGSKHRTSFHTKLGNDCAYCCWHAQAVVSLLQLQSSWGQTPSQAGCCCCCWHAYTTDAKLARTHRACCFNHAAALASQAAGGKAPLWGKH